MKHALRNVIVCLVLGAAVNVLVAWVIAGIPQVRNLSKSQIRPRFDTEWTTVVPVDWKPPGGGFIQSGLGYNKTHMENAERPELSPADQVLSARDNPAIRRIAMDERFGLPLLGFRSSRLFLYDRQKGIRGELPQPLLYRGIELPNSKRLPLEPLFPGFLINTACYGALVWLVAFAPFVYRRTRRRRRGRCVRCAYDLAGLDRCPECGTDA